MRRALQARDRMIRTVDERDADEAGGGDSFPDGPDRWWMVGEMRWYWLWRSVLSL